MFKTCISVAAVGKAPDIIKKIIDEIGFPISTIVIKPGRVNFYFCYKWYDYYHVYKIKREVKKCEERCKYYYKPDIYWKLLSKETKFSSEQCSKSIAGFTNVGIQGYSEDRNGETTVNKEELK